VDRHHAVRAGSPIWEEMAPQGFTVVPAQLTLVAAEFQAMAQELNQVLGDLAPPAPLAAGLFGLLPAARSAFASYQETTQAAMDGLRKVAMALDEDVGAGLRATAANYLGTEEANTFG
jgi:hypothetical protein